MTTLPVSTTGTVRKLIGHFTVDSGQFVIVDPAYLARWQDNDFQDIRRFKRNDSNKVLQYGVDFHNFQSPIPSEGDWNMNDLIDAGVYASIPNPPPAGGYGLDYNSACLRTLSPERGGELRDGMNPHGAVATRTAWGDGEFPVYRVEDSEGNLLRIEISFEEE